MHFCFARINTFIIFASTKILIKHLIKNLTDMKKVLLSLVAVALFGTMALTSCKSGNTEATTDSTAVEAPAPTPVDTNTVDSATATPDTTVAK